MTQEQIQGEENLEKNQDGAKNAVDVSYIDNDNLEEAKVVLAWEEATGAEETPSIEKENNTGNQLNETEVDKNKGEEGPPITTRRWIWRIWLPAEWVILVVVWFGICSMQERRSSVSIRQGLPLRPGKSLVIRI